MGVVWVKAQRLAHPSGQSFVCIRSGYDLEAVDMWVHPDDVAEACPVVLMCEPKTCAKCGHTYPEAGDGWDGMCPSCADRDEEGEG